MYQELNTSINLVDLKFTIIATLLLAILMTINSIFDRRRQVFTYMRNFIFFFAPLSMIIFMVFGAEMTNASALSKEDSVIVYGENIERKYDVEVDYEKSRLSTKPNEESRVSLKLNSENMAYVPSLDSVPYDVTFNPDTFEPTLIQVVQLKTYFKPNGGIDTKIHEPFLPENNLRK